jgi:Peptidase family M23
MTTIAPQISPRGLRRIVFFLISAALTGTIATAPPTGRTNPMTARHTNARTRTTLTVVSTTLSGTARSWSYGWPIRPFNRQHPVRAFLNDPRVGEHGGKAFHFGIDISAPDGTAVYAVEAGTVYLDSPRAIAVVSPHRSHTFGYWHIVPVVESHQYVERHQLLGHIDTGWEHVHFAESRGGTYLNPLRDGGLGPYVDRTAPTVDAIRLAGFALVAVAHDTPDPRVPGGWADEPVTAALLRWRIDGGTWRTAADFRSVMLPKSIYGTVYTPGTRQNHKGEPGSFRFYLARSWKLLGTHRIDVAASDTVGNRTVASALVGVEL